jgi:hypothetical protein
MPTQFQTFPVTQTSVALYSISLRSPGALSSVFNGMSYTFPISPQAIRREKIAYNTVMDVASSAPGYAGVQRIVDQFGESLPIYTIRGTTGWKYHSTDGYVWTGLQSVQRIEAILTSFATQNQTQIQQGNADNLYTLEFYDYFRDEFWEVVPIGPQGTEQSSDRPLLNYYTFRFACIRDVSAPIPAVVVDETAALLGANGIAAISLTTSAVGIYQSVSNSVNSAVQSVQNFSLSTITNYL